MGKNGIRAEIGAREAALNLRISTGFPAHDPLVPLATYSLPPHCASLDFNVLAF